MALFKYLSRNPKPRGKNGGFGSSVKAQIFGLSISQIINTLIPVLSFFIIWLTCAVRILYRPTVTTGSDFVIGQKVQSNIYSQIDFEYIDEEKTAVQRQQAADNISDIYHIDRNVNTSILRHFQELFDLVSSEISKRKKSKLNSDDFSQVVLSVYNSLSREQINELITLFGTNDKRNFFIKHLEKILQQGVIAPHYFEGYSPSGEISILDNHLRSIKTKLVDLKFPEVVGKELLDTFSIRFGLSSPNVLNDLSQNVVSKLIFPNLIFEGSLTAVERKNASERLLPVKNKVQEGALILEKGEFIDEKDLIRLGVYKRELTANLDGSHYFLKIIFNLIFTTIVITIGIIFLINKHQKVEKIKSNFLLISLAISLNILFVKFIEDIFLLFISVPPIFIYPALPLAFSAVLLTLLLGKELGLTAGLFVALLVSITSSDPLQILLLGLISSCVGTLSIKSARTRTKTFHSALAIGLTIFIIESVYLMLKLMPPSTYLTVFGIAIVNGFFLVLLTNLLLPITEYLFPISTSISLLELSDLNHPLLKRLQIEAPGTYHHTLMVATLSEQAAEAIGCNTLLTRVCTYFHDIGKLSNPSYFSENSLGIDRHEDLSPRMSSLIILNHVKEGLAMAKKNKLKKSIRDVIASHHGTSLVYFFFKRAVNEKSESDKDRVCKEDFRYPGPLPQSKEASIISLADSCEAASRSLQKPTPQKIKTLVSEIVRNKIVDGQLNDSELSMSEINIVEEIIIKALTTMLHGRIAYPKIDNDEDSFDKPAKDFFSEKSEDIDSNGRDDSETNLPEKPVVSKV